MTEKKEKSEMELWAEREVELACNRENPDRKEGEFDYGCACYISALKAFKSLLGDGHTGMSIDLTKQILNRLIDGKTLTPVEDKEEDWNYLGTDVNHNTKQVVHRYQCNRMGSLFKDVLITGEITYSDVDRCYCMDIHKSHSAYQSGLSRRILDNMYPIKMPYCPADKPYIFRCEEFLTNPKNGNFDTVGFIDLKHPDGSVEPINRYFRQGPVRSQPWIEINHEEYLERRSKANEK
jgi:hypothetical protein